ncbi:MAG: ABC transporter permease, partial [Terriglobales bacterium]
MAWGLQHLLGAAAPATLPQLQSLGLNLPALLIAMALAIGCGLACGLAPVFSVRPHDLQNSLREDNSTAGRGRGGARLRSGLVVAQVAVAFVLIVGAALLIESFLTVEAVGAGVQTRGRVTAALDFPATNYAHPSQIAATLQQIEAGLEHTPAVQGVLASSDLPTRPTWGRIFLTYKPRPGERSPLALFSVVMGNLPQVLGVPLVQGRWFTPAEEQQPNPSAPVVVVSQSIARHNWPGRSAIGQRLMISGIPMDTVVGVVADVKNLALDLPARDHIYAPYRQECTDKRTYAQCSHIFLVTAGPGVGVAAAAMRNLAGEYAPSVPVTKVRSLGSILQSSIAPRRFNTLLLGFFGGSALGLALVGLYAVMALSVNERQKELSLRMVLGARPGAICGRVLAQGGTLTIIGLA